MKISDFGKKLLSAAPWLVMVMLVLVNALLLKQNLGMRAELDKLKPKLLQSGDTVRSFNARGLQDEVIAVRYPGEGPKRVLFYFKPSCPFCKDQFAYWQEIMKKIDSSRFEVLGLVADYEDKGKVVEYLQSVGCEGLPVARIAASELASYKLSGTPITLIVSNNGKVERAWVGLWDDKGIKAASSLLSVAITAQNLQATQ